METRSNGIYGKFLNFKKHKFYQYHYQWHDIKLSLTVIVIIPTSTNQFGNDLLMLKLYIYIELSTMSNYLWLKKANDCSTALKK